MTCAETQELIEAVASGDLPPTPQFELHVRACDSCRSALAAATRIHRALTELPVREAPARFSQAVIARIRRERWQHDEHVDRAFNAAIVAGIVAVGAGALSLLNLNTVVRLLLMAVETLNQVSREPGVTFDVPPILAILLPALIIATAFGAWWWAEQRLSYRESKT